MTLCVLPVCLLAWLSRLFCCCLPPSTRGPALKLRPLCSHLSDHLLSMSPSRWCLHDVLRPEFQTTKQIMCSWLLLLILSLPMWVYQLPVYFYMMSLLCNLFMLLLSVKFTTSVVFASASPICWKPVKCLCLMYVSVLQRHFQTSASYEFEWNFVLNK